MADLVDLGASLPQAIEIARQELEDLAKRIIANHDRAGQRATGKTAESFHVEKVSDTQIRLVARPFVGALETGSSMWTGHTGVKCDRPFHEIIEEWAIAKGITPEDGASIEDFAWAVAKKIQAAGTQLFRKGGRHDIFSNEIPLTKDAITKKIGAFYSAQINDIIQTINNYQRTGQWQQQF